MFARVPAAPQTGRAVRDVAADLFEAAIRDGLTATEAADCVVVDPDYQTARRAWDAKQRGKVSGVALPERFVSALRVLQPLIHRNLVTAASYRELRSKLRGRTQGAGVQIPCATSPTERAANPLWFLEDSELPGVVMRGMLAAHREYAVTAAFDGFARRFAQKLGDLRLLDAAAQVWVDEARRYLALLASIPGNDIPASKIPMHERVDLDARIGEHRSTMAALRDTHV